MTRVGSQPVYNIRRGAIEATSKNLTNKQLAEEVFKQLEKNGHIPASMKYSVFSSFENEIKPAMLKIIQKFIKDKDNDGYKDINLKKLVSKLKEEGFSLKYPEKAEKEISRSPVIDTYFDDGVFSKLGLKQSSSSLRFRDNTIKKGIAHFRKKAGKWDSEELKKDLQDYLDANFIPPTGVGQLSPQERQDAVNDAFSNTSLTDKTLTQFSKNKDGQYRADCGVYANIAFQMLKAAGLEVKYGWANLLSDDLKPGVGHVIVVGKTRPRGKKVFIVSNNTANYISGINTVPNDKINHYIKGNYKLEGFEYTSIHFGESLANAKKASKTKWATFERLWNMALTHTARLNSLLKNNNKTKLDKEIAFIKSALVGMRHYIDQMPPDKRLTFRLDRQVVALRKEGLREFNKKLSTLLGESNKLDTNSKNALAAYFKELNGNERNILCRVAKKILKLA